MIDWRNRRHVVLDLFSNLKMCKIQGFLWSTNLRGQVITPRGPFIHGKQEIGGKRRTQQLSTQFIGFSDEKHEADDDLSPPRPSQISTSKGGVRPLGEKSKKHVLSSLSSCLVFSLSLSLSVFSLCLRLRVMLCCDVVLCCGVSCCVAWCLVVRCGVWCVWCGVAR